MIWARLLQKRRILGISPNQSPRNSEAKIAKSMNLEALSRLWWSNPWTRIFVVSIIPISLIDDVYSWIYIGEYGLAGEVNPVTRFFFQSNLSIVWAVLNALVPFILMALLGSLCETHRGESKSWIASAFSALFTLKILVVFHHAHCFNMTLSLLSMFICLLSFVSVRCMLLDEDAVKLASIRNRLWIRWLSISGNVAGISWTRMQGFVGKSISETSSEFKGCIAWKRFRGYQLLLLLLAFLVLPVLLLKFIDLLADLLGIRSLPFWEAGLGIVSWHQAVMFLLTFIVMLSVVCVIMYLLLSVFS